MLSLPDATTLALPCIQGVRNLILYHTEDKTLETRKTRYTSEAETAFRGRVWVPDDLESIIL